jgi:hypothetical protein
MICVSLAPQLAHSVAFAAFIAPQSGQAMSGWANFNSAPHFLQTLSIGLKVVPHSGHLFIVISAGLKHMGISSYFSIYCFKGG